MVKLGAALCLVLTVLVLYTIVDRKILQEQVLAASAIKTMPGEGYSSNSVVVNGKTYKLICIGGSRSSTQIVTDSANDNDCKNDCPVLSLNDYVSRNGGYAGMNGMYFCPSDYSWCQAKKNSFDTLFFNSRSKRYLNSDNNVYSVLPFLAVLSDGTPRFVGHGYEWGRDTGIQAGIMGNPLLVAGGRNVVGNYSLDNKQRNGRGAKGAVVRKGNVLYLCIIGAASVPESADVYTSLGVDEAMNIDGGGSTALYLNGRYIYGPGRRLPTAIVFKRK
jgi:exopolysaccharide biosynthesis protein